MDNIYSGVLLQPTISFDGVRDGRRSTLAWQEIDLSVPRSILNGTHLVINMAGDSFYADKGLSQGNAVVRFQDTNLSAGGFPAFAEPGFIGRVPFTQILIENDAQPGKKFLFAFGVNVDFSAGSSTSVNAFIRNTVAMVDGEKDKSLAGGAFVCSVAVGGIAGQFSIMALGNPAGSGKNVIVSDVIFSSGSAGVYVLRAQAAASIYALGQIPISKLVGGDAPVARFTSANAAAAPVAAATMELALTQPGPFTRAYKQPIILPPNSTVYVHNNTIGADMYASLQFTEEAL